jgi:hypothetical protein
MALSRYVKGFGGVVDLTKLEQYRRFARACLELARNSEDKRARASLLHMAQVWHRLAEEPASDVEERRSVES